MPGALEREAGGRESRGRSDAGETRAWGQKVLNILQCSRTTRSDLPPGPRGRSPGGKQHKPFSSAVTQSPVQRSALVFQLLGL